MQATGGPVHHRVDITDLGTWFNAQLGFDPRQGVTLTDWLSTPTQRLAEVTAGAVLHDGLGRLIPARANLDWYSHDLWLHLLGCQWQRISQEEAFVGLCGEVGDELGSAVVASRLVRDLMRFCLLMDRRYPPYSPQRARRHGPIDPTTRPYHNRPFQVLHAERFTAALTARITDPAVRKLPMTGTVDQFIDSTDALGHPELTRAVTRATAPAPAS